MFVFTDEIRAAFLLVAGNVVSAVVLFGIASLSADQVAILNSMVSSSLTLLMLLFKKGQSNTLLTIGFKKGKKS